MLLLLAAVSSEAALQKIFQENHNITVFDKNEDLVNSIVDKYDVQGYVGGATIKKDLEEVGRKRPTFRLPQRHRMKTIFFHALLRTEWEQSIQ